jgi:ATP-dependent DNA ligase
MKTFPTLYQKMNTGAIQQWSIWVEGTAIYTEYGQVYGKMQVTKDTIKEGKNTGKLNATTVEEQAEKEAQAKHQKQLKKGYVYDIASAEKGLVDTTVIKGGIEPMLAPNKSYPKDDLLQKRIKYPCYIQPKLDGMRCIAIIKNGKAKLWSRTRKPILSVPHIIEALEKQFPGRTIILDGELYSHEYRDNFQALLSILTKDHPDPEGIYLNAEYHCYDLPELEEPLYNHPFENRSHLLDRLFNNIQKPIALVPTYLVPSFEKLVAKYEEFLLDEYEGGMAKNKDAPYKCGSRSMDLQKMKEFAEDEFPITGINDGRGKDEGTVATFTCLTKEGKEFHPRLRATYEYRRKLFNTPSMWEGKNLTVKFKRWTNDGYPYIPIGKAIRNPDGSYPKE